MKILVSRSPAVCAALAAAVLFGLSTPIAKALLRGNSPILLAGLLYLGSGVGLGGLRLLRDRGWRMPAMPGAQWLWLLLAVGFGGVLGPVALMLGLARTSASAASLLLNLEAVLTAVLAWVVFHENADRTNCRRHVAHCPGRGRSRVTRDVRRSGLRHRQRLGGRRLPVLGVGQ